MMETVHTSKMSVNLHETTGCHLKNPNENKLWWLSSGLLHLVDWYRFTHVLEVFAVSIIRAMWQQAPLKHQ
jgi:hypothetical protein